MDPQQELVQWAATRKAFEARYGDQGHLAPPEEIAAYNGETLSPQAKAYTTGAGVGGQHFDVKTGEIAKNKERKWYANPELYAAAAMTGGIALPYLLGAGAATGAAGAAGAAAPAAATGAGGILSTAGKLAGLAGTIGQTANALTQGRAAGRINQTNIDQNKDRLALLRYQSELEAARTNLAAPGQRAKTSVQGDILANAQPFRFTGGTQMVGNIPVPQSTGGLNPGLFSPNTRALGGQLSSQALADNTAMGGKAIGAPPPITPTPNATGLDTMLNTAGIIGGGLQLFGDTLAKYRKPKPATDPNDPNALPPTEMG